jgi:hypothetical protein
MGTDLEALTAACLKLPMDMGLRLALADWCLENGRTRADDALRLGQDLLAAADDPAWDWEPPVKVLYQAVGGHIPPGERQYYYWRNGAAHRRWHNPRPWFPREFCTNKWAWAGRTFATAAVRWSAGNHPLYDKPWSYPQGDPRRTVAACELSAAGLIGPPARDSVVLSHVRRMTTTDGEFHFSLPNSPGCRAIMAARSGHVGHVQHVVNALTCFAWGFFCNRGDYSAGSGRYRFERDHCAGGWHLRPLLRMARRLRHFFGCDTCP